jgi:hypothetical protein
MQPPKIEDVLSYEIKKEIADRYFGFRKLIEEDKMDLNEKIRQQSLILEKRICFELVRIYILLADEELINAFIALIGWEEKLYYDPYLPESLTIRKRVFQGVKKRGLTRAGRFKNLLFDGYERLEIHIEQYRENLQELIESRELINEEINLFYRKHDIGNIMGFLRNLDANAGTGSLGGGVDVGMDTAYEEKMRVKPPPPIEQQLPIIPPLVALANIRKELKKLIDKAYILHGDRFLETLPQ